MALLLLVAAADVPYRALGTEPFWSLTIVGARATMEEPGQSPRRIGRVRRAARRGGWNYRAPRLRVSVTVRPCSDGMSDRRFPHSVTVRWRGRTLRGCGGMPGAPGR